MNHRIFSGGFVAGEILLAKTPEERLRMGSRMSMGARAIVVSGVRAELGPDATETEVRRAAFLRFYAGDLGRERATTIFDALEVRRSRRTTEGVR